MLVRLDSRSHRAVAGSILLSCALSASAAGAQTAPPQTASPVPRPATPAILSHNDIHHPVFGSQGMVTSQKAEATRIGLAILERGGNAVDAAVAVGFALAVVLPRAGNLGGGGFMVAHLSATGQTVAFDYREMAPAAAHADLFLDADGNVDNDLANFSHRSAGVPGTVRGLVHALERYGTLPLADVLAPAIALAEEGMIVSNDLHRNLAAKQAVFARSPASVAIFLHADGTPWQAGERFVQRDLAWSLKQIAEQGPTAFYDGPIAARLVADMKAHDGLITREDLRAYRVAERKPVRGTYRGYEVVSMPPPSSGGVHLVQMLNVLEGFPLGFLGSGGAESIHIVAETMKRTYADRAAHLGDPDHWDVPLEWLVSKQYADEVRQGIDRYRAMPSSQIGPGTPPPPESPDTTHFSVADRFGNVVSNTTTLNFSYGSGIVAEGTGFLLNNEMDDFSAKPGVPNAYGLIGGRANAIAATKRPLSSMTPTLVLRDGKPVLATGSPGGSRIITTVLQIVLNVIDHGMNIATATAAPRFHHQWLPDELRIETGFSPDTLRLLTAMGHHVKERSAMGSTQSIVISSEGFYGAADTRRPDALALGY